MDLRLRNAAKVKITNELEEMYGSVMVRHCEGGVALRDDITWGPDLVVPIRRTSSLHSRTRDLTEWREAEFEDGSTADNLLRLWIAVSASRPHKPTKLLRIRQDELPDLSQHAGNDDWYSWAYDVTGPSMQPVFPIERRDYSVEQEKLRRMLDHFNSASCSRRMRVTFAVPGGDGWFTAQENWTIPSELFPPLDMRITMGVPQSRFPRFSYAFRLRAVPGMTTPSIVWVHFDVRSVASLIHEMHRSADSPLPWQHADQWRIVSILDQIHEFKDENVAQDDSARPRSFRVEAWPTAHKLLFGMHRADISKDIPDKKCAQCGVNTTSRWHRSPPTLGQSGEAVCEPCFHQAALTTDAAWKNIDNTTRTPSRGSEAGLLDEHQEHQNMVGQDEGLSSGSTQPKKQRDRRRTSNIEGGQDEEWSNGSTKPKTLGPTHYPCGFVFPAAAPSNRFFRRAWSRCDDDYLMRAYRDRLGVHTKALVLQRGTGSTTQRLNLLCVGRARNRKPWDVAETHRLTEMASSVESMANLKKHFNRAEENIEARLDTYVYTGKVTGEL